MIYDDNQNFTFFAITVCYGILYTNDIDEFIKEVESVMEEIENSDFLEFFLEIVTNYSKKGKLSSHTINNIQIFIAHYRFKKEVLNNPKIKSKVYNICNSLINLINSQKLSDQLPAYYEEIQVRYNRKLDLVLKTFSYWNDEEKFVNAIHTMREIDFIILCIHSELILEEDFKEELIDLLANPYYLVCIEYLLNAYPKLFEDKKFKERILFGLNINKELISEAKGKRIEESEYYMMDDDIEILKNQAFIKTNKKLMQRIKKIEKDS